MFTTNANAFLRIDHRGMTRRGNTEEHRLKLKGSEEGMEKKVANQSINLSVKDRLPF